MKVIAIDVRDKPNEIPNHLWIKKGKEYTIIKIMKLKMQGGIAGVKLAELNIDAYFPYTYFALWRFGFPVIELAEMLISKEIVEEV